MKEASSAKAFVGFKKLIAIASGPFVFVLLLVFVDLSPGHPLVTYTLACALWMAIWWISEAVPLAVTSLLPVVLFPLLGVMDGKAVSSTYFNHVIFLFLGGFIVALAMQKWDLHKRIALKILMYTGIGPGRILLGFMGATAFLSMWISNTATTMMMIPILISIIAKLEESIGKKDVSRYSIGLLLGVAYSASIGGVATLVGTPPQSFLCQDIPDHVSGSARNIFCAMVFLCFAAEHITDHHRLGLSLLLVSAQIRKVETGR